jgi:cardiolipin synthase
MPFFLLETGKFILLGVFMPHTLDAHPSKMAFISCAVLLFCILFATTALFILHVPVANMASIEPAHRPPTSISSPISPTTTASGQSGSLQLFVEPAAGEQVILTAINNAHQSIWLEMYLLTDTAIIRALEHAASLHLDVRVMLEGHPYGGGDPQSTLSALQAAGASTNVSSPDFTLTHEKGMVVDGTTSYIMSTNFTYSALNGKNREYGIIDTQPQDVQGVKDIFTADWNRVQIQPSDPALVVSPTNSRDKLTALINSAKKTLQVEAEEMLDSTIEQALVSAAQRGVQVEVILPAVTSGSTDSNAAGIATLKAGGVLVKEDGQLYMHAKMMVVDGHSSFVGSENISGASLDGNRELGLILSDPGILTTIQQTFQADWSISQTV